LERATELAAAFQSRGVNLGDRVALIMSSGVPFVEAFWGLQLVEPFLMRPTTLRRWHAQADLLRLRQQLVALASAGSLT